MIPEAWQTRKTVYGYVVELSMAMLLLQVAVVCGAFSHVSYSGHPPDCYFDSGWLIPGRFQQKRPVEDCSER